MGTNSKVSRSERRETRKEVRQADDAKLSWFEKQLAQMIAKKIYKHFKKLIDMASWKTTMGGALGALGTFLITVTDPTWLPIIGQVLVGLGILIIGASARDNGVTSKQAGAE